MAVVFFLGLTCPKEISDKLKSLCNGKHGLKNREVLVLSKAKTNPHKRIFTYAGVENWNKQPR